MRKYQSFNSSCAYAGIANLLLKFGVDVEDRDIIINSNAAYQVLYNKEKNAFSAGYKVQGKYWFNCFLNMIGFEYIEVSTNIDDYISRLQSNIEPHIIGLWINDIERHVHNYIGIENNKYKFLNNKWIDSNENDFLYLNETEIRSVNRYELKYGYLQKLNFRYESFDKTYFLRTLDNIEYYLIFLKYNFKVEKPIEVHIKEKETIYRTLLLDMQSMLEILGYLEMSETIKLLRSSYLRGLKKDAIFSLNDILNFNEIETCILFFKNVVEERLSKI